MELNVSPRESQEWPICYRLNKLSFPGTIIVAVAAYYVAASVAC